jgi:4,5-dihydroxyphthalate decarboxylase
MLHLRGTFSPNPRLEPLLDGTVKAKDMELTFESGQAGELHERHLRDNAFDVFEFSISHYMMTREHPGKWEWVALPIFFSKAFMTLAALTNVNSGIESPKDIKGKRFGVPDYSMTAALWFRGMLRGLYGTRTADNSWVIGRTKEHSHAALIGIDEEDLPKNIPISWATRHGQMNELLQSGEIDVAYPAGDEVALDATSGKVRPLFPDGGRAFVQAFVEKTGFAPVNHTVIVQRRIVEENPWVADALFEAFEKSKQEAYRRNPASSVLFPRQPLEGQRAVFGADPFPSGVKANRPMLQMATEQSVEDGLAPKPINVDELFWPSLRGT